MKNENSFWLWNQNTYILGGKSIVTINLVENIPVSSSLYLNYFDAIVVKFAKIFASCISMYWKTNFSK